MIKFPSIDQFRQVVREVKSHTDFVGKDENGDAIYRHDTPYPLIEFKGTVKLHGTNAAIVKYKDRIEYQSRERVLDLLHDNSGFMLNMSNKNIEYLFDQYFFTDYIAVFGEWCGQGIQKGVAISELPKMFVVFAINVDGEWSSFDHIPFEALNKIGVYHIEQFDHYLMTIDFNSPELNQNKLIEITEEVEKECPVGRYFNILGGIGEGVVWKAKYKDQFYQFKVKGEKHSISKVKTLASVDVEMVENINQFVENVLTEQRLEQGITWLKENGKEVSQKSTGDYLRWVVTDMIKEESDTIVENQLDAKKINSSVSVWFFNYLNKEVFVK